MSLFKTAPDFSPLQKRLHWIVAIVMILQLFILEEPGRAFKEMLKTGVAQYDTTMVIHLGLGLAVLVLALWRLTLQLTRGAPAAPEAEPAPFRLASKLAHLALYGLMILIPAAGLVAWFAPSEQAGEAHELLSKLMILLLIGHVGAVAVHQIYWKTNLLARMR